MVATAPALPVRAWPREAAALNRQPGTRPGRPGRTRELIEDAGIVIGLVYLLPFAILLAGAPIALVLKGLLWLAGAL